MAGVRSMLLYPEVTLHTECLFLELPYFELHLVSWIAPLRKIYLCHRLCCGGRLDCTSGSGDEILLSLPSAAWRLKWKWLIWKDAQFYYILYAVIMFLYMPQFSLLNATTWIVADMTAAIQFYQLTSKQYCDHESVTVIQICFVCFQIARWSKLWKLIQDGECETCADFVIDSDLDLENNSVFDSKVKKFLMDRSILKVHLPNGGFNMVKYGDATDVKVS